MRHIGKRWLIWLLVVLCACTSLFGTVSGHFTKTSKYGNMRYNEDVPILVPETNLEQLSLIEKQGYPNGGFVITNANCVTTGLTMLS